jgi:DNA-binding NarL/FixJ family response regulator
MLISEPDVLLRRADLLLVDDHVLLSETLSAGLSATEGLTIDYVNNVDMALENISRQGRYPIILLDYCMPGIEWLDALQRLAAANDGGVTLFSGVAGRSVAERAISMGAQGFIPKTIGLKTLGNALRFIAGGETYLPREYLTQHYDGKKSDLYLKPREQRVLSYLCEGATNKKIGGEIGVAETIIKMDVKTICRKLGVRNRTQAVIEAQKRGLT